MSTARRRSLTFIGLVGAAVLVASLAPLEKVLGTALRTVYLHGAWVWAALLTFAGAAVTGAAGLIARKPRLHAWSAGLGRSGTVFWLTSLLLSLAAMQTSWNGLYLAEPRWRLGVRFGIFASLLQIAAALLQRPRLTSAMNVGFFAAILIALLGTEEVMHPASPVLASQSVAIRASFIVLLALVTAAAVQLAQLLCPDD